VFPDIDVVGFRFGVGCGDFWGHRGFTHSLVFAVLLAALAPLALFRKPGLQISAAALWAYFFLAAASHGVLDAMTDGGLGVAFFFHWMRRAIFVRGVPLWFRRSGSRAFLAREVCPYCAANCFGSGCRYYCSRRFRLHGAG
jgi:inner membrane protein